MLFGDNSISDNIILWMNMGLCLTGSFLCLRGLKGGLTTLKPLCAAWSALSALYGGAYLFLLCWPQYYIGWSQVVRGFAALLWLLGPISLGFYSVGLQKRSLEKIEQAEKKALGHG